jgi:hypothetical protein
MPPSSRGPGHRPFKAFGRWGRPLAPNLIINETSITTPRTKVNGSASYRRIWEELEVRRGHGGGQVVVEIS